MEKSRYKTKQSKNFPSFFLLKQKKDALPLSKNGVYTIMSLISNEEAVALMMRVGKGDMKAFDTLITEFRDSVVNTVYRMTGDREDAEDIAQKVFISVYKAREKYTPQAKFTTWLFRIVKNMVYNYIRDNNSNKNISFANIDDECGWLVPVSSIPDPLKSLQLNDLQNAIDKGMKKLPVNQRTALILAKFENRAYSEIAEIIEVSETAVKMLVKRAKQNMALLLKEYLYGFRCNIFVWLAPLTAAAALITVSVLLWRYSENPALPVVAMPGTDIAENDLRVIRNIELLKEMENSEYNIIIKNQKTAEMFLSLLGNKDISEVPTAPATGSIFQSQTDEKPLFCEFRNHFVSTTEMEDINL